MKIGFLTIGTEILLGDTVNTNLTNLGKRLYENPYGDPVPSVTTILDKTKPKEKREALNRWKKRVGAENAQRIVTEAANVGTIMHNILEHWVKNEEYEGDSMLQAKMMADTVKQYIEADIDEVWGSEVNLCYPQLYAGTTDLVGVYKGEPHIMDFKQTNKPKKREWIDDYFIQCAAYATAHNYVYRTHIDSGVILISVKGGDVLRYVSTGKEFQHFMWTWLGRVGQYYKQQASGT